MLALTFCKIARILDDGGSKRRNSEYVFDRTYCRVSLEQKRSSQRSYQIGKK